MRYVIRKKNRVDNDCPTLSGVRYEIVPANIIFRWIYDYLPMFLPFVGYNSFTNLKEAKRCAKLKSTGKWEYTKSKEII